jgi:deoxyribose-phosphate aldolase
MTKLNSSTITFEQLAKTIDHSLLKPEMTRDEIAAGCDLAKQYNVASVCVKPSYVSMASKILSGTTVAVGTVIGFPHGSNTTETKVFEANEAIRQGATELDMVLNIGELRSGNSDYVREDIAAVVKAAKGIALVKVILENAYLTDDQKALASKLCEQAGADFVKTSTGFASTGATIEDLTLMRATVSEHVQVKAAGGIRTLDAALAAIDAGCTRLGATATAAILEEYKRRQESGEVKSAVEPKIEGGY